MPVAASYKNTEGFPRSCFEAGPTSVRASDVVKLLDQGFLLARCVVENQSSRRAELLAHPSADSLGKTGVGTQQQTVCSSYTDGN